MVQLQVQKNESLYRRLRIYHRPADMGGNRAGRSIGDGVSGAAGG